MIKVDYEADNFPPKFGIRSRGTLDTSWNEILWAALTVGRPNRAYVFRHGSSSEYEAIFRLSLVRAAVEQRFGGRLRLTEAAKTLDPTEKGAINYFLGMTFCKLFASKLLHAPWLLHLDVFRPKLNPRLRGRSRPDLVGSALGSASWYAFECKGRITAPDTATKEKAKAQAQSIVSVSGKPCDLHVGAITFFRRDVLEFFWCDPPTEPRPIEVQDQDIDWRAYYRPAFEFHEASEGGDLDVGMRSGHDDTAPFTNGGADIKVNIHPKVLDRLRGSDWSGAKMAAEDLTRELQETGYQPDGLAVSAGGSWSQRFDEPV